MSLGLRNRRVSPWLLVSVDTGLGYHEVSERGLPVRTHSVVKQRKAGMKQHLPGS